MSSIQSRIMSGMRFLLCLSTHLARLVVDGVPFTVVMSLDFIAEW